MRSPKRDSDRWPLLISFGGPLKPEFHGLRAGSVAGLFAEDEFDDALGLTGLATEALAETWAGDDGWHGLVGVLRPATIRRIVEYGNLNEAGRIRRDTATG